MLWITIQREAGELRYPQLTSDFWWDSFLWLFWKARYQKKGLGFLAGLLIAAGYFYYIPIIAKPFWHWCLTHFSGKIWVYHHSWCFPRSCPCFSPGLIEETILLYAPPIMAKLVWILALLYFYLIYHVEHPFFEQYKANPVNLLYKLSESDNKWQIHFLVRNHGLGKKTDRNGTLCWRKLFPSIFAIISSSFLC